MTDNSSNDIQRMGKKDRIVLPITEHTQINKSINSSDFVGNLADGSHNTDTARSGKVNTKANNKESALPSLMPEVK